MLSTAPDEIAELEQAMKRLSEARGEEERDKVLDKGRMMSLDEAITVALDWKT